MKSTSSMRPCTKAETPPPWLRENCPVVFNGEFVGDVYAGAIYDREPREDEWARVYTLKKLSGEQLAEARDLGKTMARAIRQGVKPYDPAALMPPGSVWLCGWLVQSGLPLVIRQVNHPLGEGNFY